MSNESVNTGVKVSTPPVKTKFGYKVFYLKDGKLYPPMVKNPGGSDTPMGVWLEASAGDIASYTKTGRPQIEKGGPGTHCAKGELAYRPGWHLGEVPIAKQFEKVNPLNGKKELFPREFVWAECEYACDVDYQEEAMKTALPKKVLSVTLMQGFRKFLRTAVITTELILTRIQKNGLLPGK